MSKCLIANISKEMMNDLEIDYSYLSDRDLQTKMNDLVIQSNQEETKISLYGNVGKTSKISVTKMVEGTEEYKNVTSGLENYNIALAYDI